jgi:hypothetical protein
VFAAAVGHDVGLADYATLAWFVASLATIGGALGSALESDDAVRAAALAPTAPPTTNTQTLRPRSGL